MLNLNLLGTLATTLTQMANLLAFHIQEMGTLIGNIL